MFLLALIGQGKSGSALWNAGLQLRIFWHDAKAFLASMACRGCVLRLGLGLWFGFTAGCTLVPLGSDS